MMLQNRKTTSNRRVYFHARGIACWGSSRIFPPRKNPDAMKKNWMVGRAIPMMITLKALVNGRLKSIALKYCAWANMIRRME